MIQVEIFQNESETNLINDINYFLEQLEEHLYIDIKYSSFFSPTSESKIIYTAMIIYKVQVV